MDKSSSESKQIPSSEWLWGSIGFFVAVILIVGYFAGDMRLLSFPFAVIAAAVAALPLLAVTVLMFVTADRETRKAYVLRFLLTAAFVAVMYARSRLA